MSSYAYPPTIDPGTISNDGSNPQHLPPVVTARPNLIEIKGSSERPESMNLGTLFDRRFRILKAIPVTFDRSGEGVSAIWLEVDEFGHGYSASAASVELARSVAELYTTLEREQFNLGPDLERVLNVLKQHIESAPR